MTADRITCQQLGQLTDGRDRHAAHAITNAVHGISNAEETIRRHAALIASEVAGAVTRLDRGLALKQPRRAPARARRLRPRRHPPPAPLGQVPGALLTGTEIAALRPAAPPAP